MLKSEGQLREVLVRIRDLDLGLVAAEQSGGDVAEAGVVGLVRLGPDEGAGAGLVAPAEIDRRVLVVHAGVDQRHVVLEVDVAVAAGGRVVVAGVAFAAAEFEGRSAVRP